MVQTTAAYARTDLGQLRTFVEQRFTEAAPQLRRSWPTGLAQVKRAFRSMKTVDLHVRPMSHFSESRVRVFLCMLAYYVEWQLREALKPLLHDDEGLATLRDQRANPVMPTPRSKGADAKAARHRTDDDLPGHSLQTLLRDLATLTYNITSTSSSHAA
ncbi:hypothetical protein RM96_31150 [Cupriavidus sp. IDO]|nr:hypothetical protein [Cupriavidus sp. IDO]KWR78148.1 hypothetical protein RM96_31150 [Cupriavidus sp. IDO]